MTHELETKVLTAVRDVLGRSDVGWHDDFFESGGSSLLVIRTITLLKERGVQVSARTFIESSDLRSIATQATLINQAD